jgi:hypothetical protein
MKWFRKAPRIDLGRFVAPLPLPDPTLEDLVEEGVLIAAAGVRLAVKNLVIRTSLRDRLDYSEARYREAVREELLNLSHEKRVDAARIGAQLARARQREGRPTHATDYRTVDAVPLARREEVSRALSERLEQLSDDEAFVLGLVRTARADAWREIGASIEAVAARRTAPVDDDYGRERSERMMHLLGDLAELEARDRASDPAPDRDTAPGEPKDG